MAIKLVSCMRNEAPFILEWVAHHLAIGFDEITIISNDCTDGSDRLLAALANIGAIRHLDITPPRDVSPQMAAYAHLAKQADYFANEDWVMVLDSDEFLNLPEGIDSVRERLEGIAKTTDIIALHWACFGDKGQAQWEKGDVSAQYLWRLADDNLLNGGVKSFVRGLSRFDRLSNHHPRKLMSKDEIRIRLPNGEYISYRQTDGRLFRYIRHLPQSAMSYEFGQINHYCIKSFDSFLLRRARGLGYGDIPRYTEEYFQKFSKNAKVYDGSILRFRAQMIAKKQELLQDRAVRSAETYATETYRILIEQIREDYRQIIFQ